MCNRLTTPCVCRRGIRDRFVNQKPRTTLSGWAWTCGPRVCERRGGPSLLRSQKGGIVFRQLADVCLFVALLVGGGSGIAQTAADASAVAAKLDAFKQTIAAEVMSALQRTNFNSSYTTVWRAYEDAAIDALCKILPQRIEGLRETNFDRGKSGREKNRPADLAIVCKNGQIEISIKAGRRSANPENDLGTFNEHPQRRTLFAASFTLWVRYDDSGREIRCDRVFFDRSWRFVGKSTLVDGVKYRKKDGNMRPKPWAMFDAGEAYWQTEEEFEAAEKRAEAHRANSLVEEHLQSLSEEDQRLLYDRLRRKFGEETKGAQ